MSERSRPRASLPEEPAPEETPTIAAVDAVDSQSPAEDPDYSISQWNGLPNYECRHCPWSTLDSALIELHAYQQHRIRDAQRPIAIPLYDRFGNLIRESEDD